MCGGKSGSITVLCGPMRAGKSEGLLSRLRRLSIAGFPSLLFTPTRGRNPGLIKCRGGDELPATIIQRATDIFELHNIKQIDTTVFVLDEAHWLPELMSTTEILARYGHRVLVGGLDMDWQGAPRFEIARVMAIAEHVIKLTAVCTQCGNDATHTTRLEAGDDEGGKWEPMCRQHWQDHLYKESEK